MLCRALLFAVPPPPPSPPIPLCDDLSAGSSTEDHHLASLPQAPTTAEIATEGYKVSLGVSADATMNGENSNFDNYELCKSCYSVDKRIVKIWNNIITNLTTKSALIKRLHNVKSVAPPNPTTCAAISCSIKLNYFQNVS